MLRQAIGISFAALLFAGCDLLGGGDEVIERSGPLMPLDVGNTWTFEQQRSGEDDTERYTMALVGMRAFDSTGAAQVDGHTFYEVQLRFEYGSEQQNFTRQTSDGLLFFYYVAEDDYKESTFFQYPVGDGSEYRYTDVRGLPFTYTVEKETIETPAGRFAAYTYSGYDEDPKVSISFAPGIGPVRLAESGSETLLVDYDRED